MLISSGKAGRGWREVCFSLATEEELVAARAKADDLEKENTEMATKLAKKEQELDQLSQEKVRPQNEAVLLKLN